MKTPEIIVTDNRQVYIIKKHWHDETNPLYLHRVLDSIRESCLSFAKSLIPAVNKASKALNEFGRFQ